MLDSNDEHLIQSSSELREIVGQPHIKTVQKITQRLDAYLQAFIAKAPMAFVSTSDGEGNLEVSPKGDAPGFIVIRDAQTLLIPERPGNKLAFGFENILATGKIALIIVVPGLTETLRIGGTARISKDPALLSELSAQGKPAVLCTIVSIDKCWFHCSKAFIRSKLWQPETWDAGSSSYAQQVSQTIGVNLRRVEKVIDDDNRDNLY